VRSPSLANGSRRHPNVEVRRLILVDLGEIALESVPPCSPSGTGALRASFTHCGPASQNSIRTSGTGRSIGGEHVTGGRVAGIASSFRPPSVEGNAVPMKTLKGFLCGSQDCVSNSETDGGKASDESRIFEPEVWQ
jgi:hypothetical protein